MLKENIEGRMLSTGLRMFCVFRSRVYEHWWLSEAWTATSRAPGLDAVDLVFAKHGGARHSTTGKGMQGKFQTKLGVRAGRLFSN